MTKSTILFYFIFSLVLATISSNSFANKIDQTDIDFLYSNNSANFDPPDPFESYNRKVFQFNQWLDNNLLAPVAQGYALVTPKVVDDSITNIFKNFGNLTSSVNYLLQAEFEKSFNSALGFAANLSFGFLGVVDIASENGLVKEQTNFNATLKKWNVNSGPYIILPFLGPNTARTIVGRVVDYPITPLNYYNPSDHRSALKLLEIVDFRSDNDSLFKLSTLASTDAYESMRIIYLKNQANIGKPQIDDQGFFAEEEFAPLN